MKLSKDDLLNIFDCAFDFDNATHKAVEAKKALSDGTLEIEGYILADHFRDVTKMVDEWALFDPNNESTFPTHEGMYLVCRGVEPYFREAKFYGNQAGFGDTCVILWRPLPKLPLEINGRYIREDRPECFSYDRKV